MSVPALTVALVIGNEGLRQEVHATLKDSGCLLALDQREIGGWPEFLGKLERTRPDMVLIGLSEAVDPLDEVVRQIKSAPGSPRVIVAHTQADPEMILRAIRANADEYVYPPLGADLKRALERMAAERAERQAASGGPRGKILGFLPAKGGCGATTVVCHLAVELFQKTRARILLADFDFDAGMVGFLMKSPSRYSLADAAANIHRLDFSFWKALVTNGDRGVDVVMAPPSPGAYQLRNLQDFRSVLPFVRSHYDWTLVDLGRGLSPLARTLLEEIDETFLVTTVEIPALHRAQQVIQALEAAGYGRDRVRLILNRVTKRTELTPQELEKMLGLPIWAMLPNDYAALYECHADGRLLEPGSILAKEFGRLAANLAGIEGKPKRRFSLF